MKKIFPLFLLAACGSAPNDQSFVGTYGVTYSVTADTCQTAVGKTNGTDVWTISQANAKCLITSQDGSVTEGNCSEGNATLTQTSVFAANGCNVTLTLDTSLTVANGVIEGKSIAHASGSCLPVCAFTLSILGVKK